MKDGRWITGLVLALAVAGCEANQPAPDGEAEAQAPASEQASPQDVWWENLQALCGQAFAGELTRYDADMDQDWLEEDVVMHVRECTDGEVRIPLHVGDDRSRTWVLTRLDDGIRLKHDHRHRDGTADETTEYGGDTVEPGTAERQEFPADEESRALFEAQGHTDGVHNVWVMEIEPGERFSYGLTRFNRDFRVDFDVSSPVDAPPPPWAVEPEPAGAD